MQPDLASTPAGSLTDWARQLADRLHLPRTLVKFLIVGGVGYSIAQVALFLLYDSPLFPFLPDKHTHANLLLFTHKDIRLLIASVASVEFAIICQFNFHERWTFRERNRAGHILKRFAKYNAASIVSPIIMVICVNVLTPVFRDAAGTGSLVAKVAPYLANTVGVLIGFSWNYALNTLIIWPRHRHEPSPAEL
ncbi:MAG TPA: GtrA family protein [Dehalococcoidia bacterium]|jgi:putative flippase GtrA|nr:GtrA family protein [Dehalococcoidia bacterium]